MNEINNANQANVKPKILLIDDNAVDRELPTLMLQANGYEVITLSSGLRCIETIEAESPHLILLDVVMPDINGNQVLQKIRQLYTQVELPVIMVTSKSDASDVIESLQIGANDYITKPVQFEVAFRRIKTHLSIAAQSKANIQAKELEAIHAMINTYSHEINNPLAIALGHLSMLKTHCFEAELDKLESALWRIADIVKKTNLVLEKGSLEYKKYSENIKMITLK